MFVNECRGERHTSFQSRLVLPQDGSSLSILSLPDSSRLRPPLLLFPEPSIVCLPSIVFLAFRFLSSFSRSFRASRRTRSNQRIPPARPKREEEKSPLPRVGGSRALSGFKELDPGSARAVHTTRGGTRRVQTKNPWYNGRLPGGFARKKGKDTRKEARCVFGLKATPFPPVLQHRPIKICSLGSRQTNIEVQSKKSRINRGIVVKMRLNETIEKLSPPTRRYC